MYTLTLIFDENANNILLCNHVKKGIVNAIGGKVEEFEQPTDASYRELEEETGIKREDVDLRFLMQENATMWNGNCWSIYITAGVLKRNVELVEEDNPLFWWDVNDAEFLSLAGYEGDLLVYIQRARKLLQI